MITGAELSRYFSQKASSAYTGYLDNTKKNRLFRDAIISVLERDYKADYDQKQWDEISFIKKTNYVLPVKNNFIVAGRLQITDFSYTVPDVTITTSLPHGLSVGDIIVLENVQGVTSTPSINGSNWTITAATTNTFTFSTFGVFGTYTAGTGQVTSPLFLNDYWHLLSIKCKFNSPLYNLNVTDATNTSPIRVKVGSRGNVRTGDLIEISGVLGNTNANGTFYVQQLNDFNFSIYTDVNYQNKVSGNGYYTSGGTLSRITYFYANPYKSNEKIGVLNKPSAYDPYFEIADKQIKIWPLDIDCKEVTVDYIREPNVVIDVADAVTDLTTYYPEKFLYAITNEAVILYANEVRDMELNQTTSQDQFKNP